MSIHKKQPTATLFDDAPEQALLDPGWKGHWVGMPEFVQDDASSWHSMTVHFRNPDDLRAFAALIKQPLGPKPRACWFPAAEIGRIGDKMYVEEPPA